MRAFYLRLLIGFITGFFLVACEYSLPENILYKIEGKTMGTSYHISYKGKENYKNKVDSILYVINQEVSTYIDTSVISAFNVSDYGIDLSQLSKYYRDSDLTKQMGILTHFTQNYKISADIYALTNGYFDPTVMPLVNYWGFGYEKRRDDLDTTIVDSLVHMVGMDKISTSDYQHYIKLRSGVQLDFSAVAKGYGVDEIARFLEVQGIVDFMVEIGGELKVRGKNNMNRTWVIGINRPQEGGTTNDLSLLIGITDCAVATSGNYRNFYISNGQKFVHTINPRTGFTEQNNLLSATIIGLSCARVDAIATACMVMGVERAKELILKNQSLDACLIYSLKPDKDSIWTTDGFNEMIISK